MTEPKKQTEIEDVSAEEIIAAYRDGYITASRRTELLHRKAKSILERQLDKDGYFKTILKRTIHHVQKGWDDFESVGNAVDVEDKTAWESFKNYGMSIWGQVEMLTAAINAFGEVNGEEAKRLAQYMGASPGLATVVGIAADVGTAFFPIGWGSRGAVKGIKGIQEVSKARRTAKTVAMMERTAEDLAKKAKEMPEIVAGALSKGLHKDGLVEQAAKIRKEAEILGAKAVDPKDLVAKVTGKANIPSKGWKRAAEAVPVVPKTSIQEKFFEDLKAAQEEIKKLTARQIHEEVAKRAEALGKTPAELIDELKGAMPGQAVDEVSMYNYLKAIEPQLTELERRVNIVVKNVGDLDAADELASFFTEFLTFAPKLGGKGTTAGRVVEILKEKPDQKGITDMIMAWDPENMAKGNFHDAVVRMAEDLKVVFDEDPRGIKSLAMQGRTIWQRFKETGWPYLKELYLNLLLSRPLTQTRNVVGNSYAALDSVLTHTLGGMFSLNKAKGIAGAGEGVYMAKGMYMAMGDGMRAFGRAFTEIPFNEASKLDWGTHKIPGKLGRIINIPGDTLGGMDNFFKTLLKRSSYYAEAMRDATQKGYKGEDFAHFVADRIKNPTQKMIYRAQKFAIEQTFQNELGTIGTKLQKMLQWGPLALWWPYMRTPINLTKYAWNRTAGLQFLSTKLYKEIKAGGVAADQAIGRITMANLQAMFIYQLVQEGFLTPGGPADPGLRRGWLLKNEPYSFRAKEGGQHFKIRDFDPGSTPLGLIADFVEVHNQLDDFDAEKGAMAIVFSIMRNMGEKSWWMTMSALSDFASSIKYGQEPGKKALTLLLNPLLTLTTGGPIVAGVARQEDDVQREARTVIDQIRRKIPGYSDELPAARDGLGQPIPIPHSVGGKIWGSNFLDTFIPFTLMKKPALGEDWVADEVARLQISISQFPNTVEGRKKDSFDLRPSLPGENVSVDLTAQEKDFWGEQYRQLVRNPMVGIESMLRNNPVYKKAPWALQREMFAGALSDLRSGAENITKIQYPGVGIRLIDAQLKETLPKVQPSERAALEEKTAEYKNRWLEMAPQERNNLLRYGVVDPPE